MLKAPFFGILLLLFGVVTSANAQEKIPVKDSKPVNEDYIFTKVDQPAEFEGGVEGWTKYLQENLKYPNKAIRKNIQGIVRIQFVVDREGNVKEVAALNNPGGGLAEEALRIIKNGPRWVPAEQNGRKVIYRHIQAITFRLTD